MEKRISNSLKLVTRKSEERTTIDVNGVIIGDKRIIVAAGPCSVESREQLLDTARSVKKAGALILRGGAFKPRTSPYSFQGLEQEGLGLLAEAREETGLQIVTEVMDPRDLDTVSACTDIVQVGTRNMYNYPLLKALGHIKKPVLLKRGFSATIDEWLNAAEYILSSGNPRVILCERGIRTFDTLTRFTLDLSAIPVLKCLTHLPVIVDPSHGTGERSLVASMSKASIAAGSDGLLIEVHPNPEKALSDGPQSLNFQEFKILMQDLLPISQAVGRNL